MTLHILNIKYSFNIKCLEYAFQNIVVAVKFSVPILSMDINVVWRDQGKGMECQLIILRLQIPVILLQITIN